MALALPPIFPHRQLGALSFCRRIGASCCRVLPDSRTLMRRRLSVLHHQKNCQIQRKAKDSGFSYRPGRLQCWWPPMITGGYYNVCFFGCGNSPAGTQHSSEPSSIQCRWLPLLYITMNISILGVVPWQELDKAATSEAHFYVASVCPAARLSATGRGTLAPS